MNVSVCFFSCFYDHFLCLFKVRAGQQVFAALTCAIRGVVLQTVHFTLGKRTLAGCKSACFTRFKFEWKLVWRCQHCSYEVFINTRWNNVFSHGGRMYGTSHVQSEQTLNKGRVVIVLLRDLTQETWPCGHRGHGTRPGFCSLVYFIEEVVGRQLFGRIDITSISRYDHIARVCLFCRKLEVSAWN